ncbi:MAG: LLM class F420-dependent oxidoreductase [Gammaproteobacteria bacterium]
MHIGFSTMNNLEDGRPDELGRQLEARGYESLWVGEHSHIPASRKTPYPAGGELPTAYKRMADMFVSLSFVAAATTRLRLGTGVALILERDVFNTAKEVATLDRLSGGRVLFGIGTGWNQEEFENVARPPWKKRYSALEECTRALRALWTQEDAAFQGEWFRFDPVWSYPKPQQQPYPPVHLGVAGRVGTAHAARWAEGWMPIDIGVKDFAPRVERFRAAVREHGRDPDKVEISVFVFGDPGADRMRRYRDMGVQRVIVGGSRPNEHDPKSTLEFMDRYAALIPELR